MIDSVKFAEDYLQTIANKALTPEELRSIKNKVFQSSLFAD